MNDWDGVGGEGEGAVEQRSQMPGAGNMLGSYRILEELASGGMGTVYRAEHARLGREVALKVLNQTYGSDKELISRFLTEARAVNQIDHENIVEITDFVEDRASGLYYIVMEFLHGEELLQVLQRERVIAQRRSIAIALQIASAFVAAHEAGIIHRDLKPDNVFLVPRGERTDFVKILDFGVAKLREDLPIAPLGLSTHVTTPGTTLGTPSYMSPEQAMGEALDHRTDIYALGVICYQMITGRLPFIGDTISDLVARQLEGPPVPPSQFAGLPEPILPRYESLIARCLDNAPARRPQTMSEVRQELQALLDILDSPLHAPPSRPDASGGFDPLPSAPSRPPGEESSEAPVIPGPSSKMHDKAALRAGAAAESKPTAPEPPPATPGRTSLPAWAIAAWVVSAVVALGVGIGVGFLLAGGG